MAVSMQLKTVGTRIIAPSSGMTSGLESSILYHGALSFNSNAKSLAHCCNLYDSAGLTSLFICMASLEHLYLYIASGYLNCLSIWRGSDNLIELFSFFTIPGKITLVFTIHGLGISSRKTLNWSPACMPLGDFKRLLLDMKRLGQLFYCRLYSTNVFVFLL